MPTWAIIAQLVITEGLPLAEAIWKKWTTGTPPTQADFDELRALAGRTAKDRMKAQLTAAGIPLDDPKALALLALTD